jgi:2'-5' RNA ligase
MNHRLFIALELPETVKDALVAAQHALRDSMLSVRWVAHPSLHLTLHFLGETDQALVAPIGAVLRQALGSHLAPRLHLTHLGAFPSLTRPQIVWAGVGGDLDRLTDIHAALAQPLAALGLVLDQRTFTPHLTLGRVKRDADAAALAQLGVALRNAPAPDETPFIAEHVTLFRSELRPGGPIYTLLDRVELVV